jgi:DNA-binding transcriptional MocR family regulator
LLWVPVTPQGFDVVTLSERLVKDLPKMRYLLTKAQNPTGITMPQSEARGFG